MKEKSTNSSLVASVLILSALASNACYHSSLRPNRRFCNKPFVEKIFSPIKKVATFSTSSSLSIQEYPSEKEKFPVRKDAHVSKNSSSFELPSHLSFKTEKALSSKSVAPSKKVTYGEKLISIKNVFKRKSGSKSLLIDIKTLAHSPSSSKISMKPIFSTTSKSAYFKEKLSLHNFKKHDPPCCTLK